MLLWWVCSFVEVVFRLERLSARERTKQRQCCLVSWLGWRARSKRFISLDGQVFRVMNLFEMLSLSSFLINIGRLMVDVWNSIKKY